MIIIAKNRKLKISDVLCHRALATADGSLRRNNKTSLVKELQQKRFHSPVLEF